MCPYKQCDFGQSDPRREIQVLNSWRSKTKVGNCAKWNITLKPKKGEKVKQLELLPKSRTLAERGSLSITLATATPARRKEAQCVFGSSNFSAGRFRAQATRKNSAFLFVVLGPGLYTLEAKYELSGTGARLNEERHMLEGCKCK